MAGTKKTKNFGGRPATRQAEMGKRVHLSLVVPLPLKRLIEQAAKAHGCSVSSEAAARLKDSFEIPAAIERLQQDVSATAATTIRLTKAMELMMPALQLVLKDKK